MSKVNQHYNKKKRFVLKMTTFVPTNQTIGEFDTKQALLFLQGELDLELLREYWEEYVEERTFERSKTLKKAGTHPVNI